MRSDWRISQIYCDWLEAQDHDKAQAADTPFRFSDVMACPRVLGYKLAGVPVTNPPSGASLAVMKMGTLLHEDTQTAVGESSPSAKFEDGAVYDILSGHIDIDDEREAVEVKSVGGAKFRYSIGFVDGRTKGAYMKEGKGPERSHVCQGGMNARARGYSTVRIVYYSRDAISAGKAEQAGLSDLQSFAWEWVIEEDEWGPIVDAEIERLRAIVGWVELGLLPDRLELDGSDLREIGPGSGWWRCCRRYCDYYDQCWNDGPGVIPIPTLREAS